MEKAIKNKPKRIKLNERTPDNDIKFAGPLSYRHIRIIAWVFMILAQTAMVFRMEMSVNPATKSVMEPWESVFSFFTTLPVPLFLLANFSTMFFKKGDFKTFFIRYGILAGGMYLLANILIFHFGFSFMNAVTLGNMSFYDMCLFFGGLLAGLGKSGYVLNIFIDMLLVTLIYFFLFYKPKTVLTGKKVFILRFLVILPIAYEVVAMIVKYKAASMQIFIPSFVFFLLPSKPPFILLAFLIIFIAIRLGEIRYEKKNTTPYSYDDHASTKAHLLKMSIIISVVFFLVAILDIVVSTVGCVLLTIPTMQAYPDNQELVSQTLLYNVDTFFNIGMFGSISLILIIPLVILYSYKKSYAETTKNAVIDLAIPVVGLLMIAIVYIEGSFWVFTTNIQSVMQKIADFVNEWKNGQPTGEDGGAKAMMVPFVTMIHSAKSLFMH